MNLRITTDVCVRSALHKGTWPVVQVGNIFYSTLQLPDSIIIFDFPGRSQGFSMFRNTE